ncbi:MAG: ParM/StbA family protein [Ignavibacterium sp.]|nr:ParM/StbA family protein [Ignavibacterium sp.]
MTNKIIGLDLGFSNTKASCNGDTVVFPSVIGTPSVLKDVQHLSSYSLLDDLFIEYEQKVFYLGKKAIRETTNHQFTLYTDKADFIADKANFLTAIGLMMKEDSIWECDIVTGLPVHEYLAMPQLQNKIKNNLTGIFDFTFRGESKTICIDNVHLILQGAGSYYDYILDEEGNIIKEHVSPKVVLIDIGFKTTNIITMEYAKFIGKESGTLYTATKDIHNEIKKQIFKTYHLNYDLTQIDEIAKKQSIEYKGKTISISSIIEESSAMYAEKIIAELPIILPNLNDIHYFILSGGGNEFIYPYLKKHLHQVICSPRPQLSNACGYEKYGLFLKKNKVRT